MSPVSPFLILPGVCANRSQIDSPLPSSFHAPSIWYEAVAAPQKNPLGKETWAGGENCVRGEDIDVAAPAFVPTSHAEKSDGSPATAPAPRAERKFRSEERKTGTGSYPRRSLGRNSELIKFTFDESLFFRPASEL